MGPGRTVPAGGDGVAAGCVAASAGRARGCSGREGASRWISGNVSLRICGVLDICRSEVPESTALLAVLVGWVGIDGIVGGEGVRFSLGSERLSWRLGKVRKRVETWFGGRGYGAERYLFFCDAARLAGGVCLKRCW